MIPKRIHYCRFRQKGRDTFVDVAKGIGMLMIVRIHTEVFTTIPCPYPIIAVPLFFFLSGFYDNTTKPLKEWLPKTFKSLFLVGVIWVLISFTYLSILSYAKNRTFHIEFSWENPVMAGGVEWFLFALFFAKIAMWGIHRSKLPHWFILIILIGLGGVISRIDLPLLLDEGIAALPFYYAGFACYPYLKKHIKCLRWPALLGIACIFIMQMNWFPILLVPYSNKPIYLYPIFFLMTLLSFMTILWLGHLLQHQEWLAKFGRQTLGILVIHPLLLHTCAISFNRLFVKGSVVWIITFLIAYVIVCIASYMFTHWIKKHTPILLGNF